MAAVPVFVGAVHVASISVKLFDSVSPVGACGAEAALTMTATVALVPVVPSLTVSVRVMVVSLATVGVTQVGDRAVVLEKTPPATGRPRIGQGVATINVTCSTCERYRTTLIDRGGVGQRGSCRGVVCGDRDRDCGSGVHGAVVDRQGQGYGRVALLTVGATHVGERAVVLEKVPAIAGCPRIR